MPILSEENRSALTARKAQRIQAAKRQSEEQKRRDEVVAEIRKNSARFFRDTAEPIIAELARELREFGLEIGFDEEQPHDGEIVRRKLWIRCLVQGRQRDYFLLVKYSPNYGDAAFWTFYNRKPDNHWKFVWRDVNSDQFRRALNTLVNDASPFVQT